MNDLIKVLKSMNEDFGVGNITKVTFRLNECDEKTLCGIVERDIDDLEVDVRFFKVENNFVTFLSHKRKLQGKA
jgi:hypothetical protein